MRSNKMSPFRQLWLKSSSPKDSDNVYGDMLIARSMKLACLIGFVGVIVGCEQESHTEAKAPPEPISSSNIAEEQPSSLTTENAPRTSDVITQLGLMRGHLLAFHELHKAGVIEHAQTHVKHPDNELYAALAVDLKALGINGFADQLTTLADVSLHGGDIESAYSLTLAAMDSVERDLLPTGEDYIEAIQGLLMVAGEEYAIGVSDDGAISNLHEYQDAYGFTNIAKIYAERIPYDAVSPATLAEIRSTLNGLDKAFDGLVPTTAPGKADLFLQAAQRIRASR